MLGILQKKKVNLNLLEGYEIQTHISYDDIKDLGLPKDVRIYGSRSSNGSGFLFAYAVTKEQAIPFGSDEEIIQEYHETMDERTGLIEVKSGKLPSGGNYVYVIRKMDMNQNEDIPIPQINYQLNFNFEIGDTMMFIDGSFVEEGTTGIRESMVTAIGMPEWEREENGLIKGWFCDPYDESYEKGFRMNLSEKRQFDEMFPEHPLSMCRSFVDYFIENN